MADQVEWSRKVRAFDLDKFEKTAIEVEGQFTPSDTLEQALARIGNDQDKARKAIDGAVLRAEIKEAKASALANAGDNVLPSAKPINDFVNNMRQTSKFASIKDRKEQTAAIHASIKADEQLRASLVLIAKAMVDVPDDDEDDEE